MRQRCRDSVLIVAERMVIYLRHPSNQFGNRSRQCSLVAGAYIHPVGLAPPHVHPVFPCALHIQRGTAYVDTVCRTNDGGRKVYPPIAPARELHCLRTAFGPLKDSDRAVGSVQVRAASDSFFLNYIERARASSTILLIMSMYE